MYLLSFLNSGFLRVEATLPQDLVSVSSGLSCVLPAHAGGSPGSQRCVRSLFSSSKISPLHFWLFHRSPQVGLQFHTSTAMHFSPLIFLWVCNFYWQHHQVQICPPLKNMSAPFGSENNVFHSQFCPDKTTVPAELEKYIGATVVREPQTPIVLTQSSPSFAWINTSNLLLPFGAFSEPRNVCFWQFCPVL